MLKPTEILSSLQKNNFGPLCGVPCSLFGSLFIQAESDPTISYYAATSEGEAMGLAAGFALSDTLPVVFMQNSGLGNAINPLTSLQMMNNLPVLLFVSWRGEPGISDAPEHIIMGEITPHLFTLIGVQHQFLVDDVTKLDDQLVECKKIITTSQKPVAIIVKKGVINVSKKSIMKNNNFISRRSAINAAMSVLAGDELIISTTGKITREIHDETQTAKNIFYMIGSMGCAPSIALGVALQNSEKKVIIFDGDGALLMKMGSVASIGHYQPKNLYHIVFDNESYESTGDQPSISTSVDFQLLANSCQYTETCSVRSVDDLKNILSDHLSKDGPSLIHIKVDKGTEIEVGRVKISPEQIKTNFMDSIKNSGS